MKKIYILSLTILLLFLFIAPAQAQRDIIKREVEKEMKEKHAEPQKEKAKKELEDITYENDSRYPIPENPVTATMVLETSNFKKNGKLKETMTVKMVFGETGECLIMNEGDKKETRILFDYKGAAIYTVNPKDKTAIKMPMINFQKMGKKLAGNQFDLENNDCEWERTNEQKEINGYNCRKYIYLNSKEKTKMNIWVTQDISIDLSGNHLLGGQIKDFSTNPATVSKLDENTPKGVMIRSVYYEKNNETPTMKMDIKSFTKESNPKYFDLSIYNVIDVLGKL